MQTIVGLFDEYRDAQSVVRELEAAGFKSGDISLLANQTTQKAHVDSGGTVGDVAGGAVSGAASGGVLGAAAGLLAGLVSLAIPGVGPVIAGGVLASTLGGAAIGATAGGLIGGLTNLGIPEEEAGLYAEGVRRGGTLVTLSADDSRVNEAVAIFNRYNPIDINQRGSYYKTSGYSGYNETAAPYSHEDITRERTSYASYAPTATTTTAGTTTGTTGTTRTVQAGEQEVIPIVQEELQVGKRTVEGGGARIHTRVIETPVSEQVTLREEHVTVDRHAVNRPLTGADATAAFTDRTIEVTERAEQAVIGKEARVVEEVVVGKEATERTETVTDTVRRTDVDVENLTTTDTTVTTTDTKKRH